MFINILNKLYLLSLIFVFAICIIGCTEVIDIDLNSAETKIVIEGAVYDNGDPAFVKISKTTDYFEPGIYPAISNAVVKISDSDGEQYVLTETKPGYYETDEINVEYGMTYYMHVEAEGEIYKATSVMTLPMEIDSLWYIKDKEDEDSVYELYCLFQDNEGIQDYARAKSYINDLYKFPGSATYSDEITDGKLIEFEFTYEDTSVEIGDIVTAEILTFDKDGFDYFNVWEQLIDRDGDEMFGVSAPDNPTSNISNNALGFFGAYSVTRKSIEIID